MDYERIYRDFIAERKATEHTLEGYTERHHIVPRSLGGGDEPENLVRLTPEDHFFAHLLLAKMHGGKMWSPVAFMVGGSRKDYQPIQSRKSYGWVIRAMARAKMREGAYQFDHRIHRLLHKDGRSWSGRQADMVEHLGIHKSAACSLVGGRFRSTKGWYLDNGQTAPTRGGANHHAFDQTIHELHHVDGRVFVGTAFDFYTTQGISPARAHSFLKGKQRSTKGWHFPGKPPLPIGRDAQGQGCRSGQYGVKEVRFVHRDGRRFRGSMREFSEMEKCSRSLPCQLATGKVKVAKGWMVDQGASCDGRLDG